MSPLAEKVYSILSGADNKQEKQDFIAAFDEWMNDSEYEGSVEELAAEFDEYYNE